MRMLNLLAENPTEYGMIVMTLVISIVIHELAHGWMAIRLGDNTPEWAGHMTLNPIVHMGPFSIAAMFLIGIAWGQMPWDPSRARGKYAEALVAVAGPASNLILAIAATVALGLWIRLGGDVTDTRAVNGRLFLKFFAEYNLVLCVFNLLPIPPLDGSRILANFNYKYDRWVSDPTNQGTTMFLFIVVFFLFAPLLWTVTTLVESSVRLIAG